MKRIMLIISLSLSSGLVAYAQNARNPTSGEANNQTSAAVEQASKGIKFESGTRLAGELQNTIDVRRAKVGDQVLLKTTEAIKSGGRTVVGKGSRLVGHVTEVAQQ